MATTYAPPPTQTNGPPPKQHWARSGAVPPVIPEEEVLTAEARSAATIGDPAALCLFGFATGTWIVGAVTAGIFKPTAFIDTAPVLIVFAGLAQFIGGLFAWRRSNTFAGTAFCAYGANNIVIGFIFVLQALKIMPMQGDGAVMLGFELLSFGFISLVMTIGAMRLNAAFVAVLVTLTAGFVLSGIPLVSGTASTPGPLQSIGYIGGYLLIASAGLAYYTGAALVLNSVSKRVILPLLGEA